MLNDLYHALDPVAISAGPITIYWYGLAYIFGAILTAVIMYRTQRRWGMDLTVDDLVTVVVGVVFGLIIGGRLFYVIFYGDGYYWAHPLEIFAVNQGGMSFHGGLVGAVLGGSMVSPVSDVQSFTVADLAVTGAPIALFLGRCANFVNGELWGKRTDLPWGVVFETGGGVARHPSRPRLCRCRWLVRCCSLCLAASRSRPRVRFWACSSWATASPASSWSSFACPMRLGYLFGGVVTMGQVLSLPLLRHRCRSDRLGASGESASARLFGRRTRQAVGSCSRRL